MKIYKTLPGLRARREASGLNVPAAAAAIGVPKQTWYQWEAGSPPGAGYLPAIAEALGCRMEQLYEEADDATDKEAGG